MSQLGFVQSVDSESINWDGLQYYNSDKPRKGFGTKLKIELYIDDINIATRIIKNLNNRNCEPILALLNCVDGEPIEDEKYGQEA